ncbi:MAG: hypothetical protein HY741_23035 [Chloroflexi bacterium]|nr:hypothetical protein [Chloroflexota bacterium]
MPELTLQVIEKVPAVTIGVALAMSGIAWWRGRTDHRAQDTGGGRMENKE